MVATWLWLCLRGFLCLWTSFLFISFGFYLVDLLGLIQYHFRRFMVNALDATISCTYPFFLWMKEAETMLYTRDNYPFWLAGIFILKILVSSYHARIYANLLRKHLVLTKGQKKCFATSTRNIEVTRWRIYHKYILKVYDWIENRYIGYYYAIIVRLLTKTLVPLTSIGSEYQCRELPLPYVAGQYSRP